MTKFRVLAAALAASAFLAGCGGSDPGDQTPRVAYGHMVNFGDSLSDVGTYDVSFVAAAGGGHYSVNETSETQPYINWTEYLAAQLQLSQPCAAVTGLNTIQAIVGVPPVPATSHAGCYSYAQGGARVTNPVGPGNAALVKPGDPTTYSNAIGQLTYPIVTQIQNHLTAVGGAFAADDLVTVFAGGNDLIIQAATFKAMVAAGVPPTTAATTVVTAMGTAGAELAAYVGSAIVAKGATHVVVVNLPDVSLTPYAIESEHVSPGSQALVLQMTQAFNAQLTAHLPASSSILLVDAFTGSQDQAANPAQYGLTNVTEPACDLTKVSTSLLCTANTLIPEDVSAFEYADTVHPTPYGYRLLAQLVSQQMAIRGWL